MITLILSHSGQTETVSLPVITSQVKRLESFVYSRSVPASSVATGFIGWNQVSAHDSIHIVDLSGTLTANTGTSPDEYITTQVGSILYVDNLDVEITNAYKVTSTGEQKPLWYAHKLSDTVSSITVHKVTNGITSIVDPIHYELSTGGNIVFFDLKNKYNEETGEYELYYATYMSGTEAVEDMLETRPAFHEATLDDIDPSTGFLYPDGNGYLPSSTGTTWSLTMPSSDSYFIRKTGKGSIRLLEPALNSVEDAWIIRVSNSEFTTLIDSVNHTYSIPEFDSQGFTPSKPYLFTSNENAIKVTPSLIKLQREDVRITPESGFHTTIFLKDSSTQALETILTTDASLADTYYSTSGIRYTYGIIQDINNKLGIIRLTNGLVLDRHDIEVSYHYESNEFPMVAINFNPYQNPSVLGNTVVFYLIPDLSGSNDLSLQYLIVDVNVITYCSQSGGALTANLSEFLDDGSLNPNTVVGMDYNGSGGFLEQYAAGVFSHAGSTINGNGLFLIIGEANTVCPSILSDMVKLDARRRGGVLNTDNLDTSIMANAKALYFPETRPVGGFQWPQMGSSVVHVPFELHEDYGGELDDDGIRELVQKHMAYGEYAIIELAGVIPELGYLESPRGVYSDSSGSATIRWHEEDPTYTFNVYIGNSKDGDFTLADTVAAGATSSTITSLTTGNVYYFYVVAVSSGGLEGPPSKTQGIRIT